MYLSRLILNPHSRQVQREISDAYQMHRTILQAFRAVLPDPLERILFRLEEHPDSGLPVTLVQSQKMPDWEWLKAPERTYLMPGVVENPVVKEFHLQPSPGQIFVFRLRANPTYKKTAAEPDARQGKRLGILREGDQEAWLERKLQDAGCELLQVRVSERGQVTGWRVAEGQRSRMVFQVALFDGYLRVNDPEKLLSAVKNGIGSAKGFGFGLLSLARPQ
ncbi:MAG TPA: type I-E CRISPR-associated protein Cas6/Cse3/CasE [Anaerolineaceae bacterium]|nr:type I-E CRISPR-associated protein Cas6/Cse3/CasE [Anaerolineaceae bacterium]HOH21427.1 type I-E CRISPR-associated protein Cas6/Cse3/CasE [Anaerolineaceae bacterium]HQH36854.1 type I-E CRISPR-associated protein Cas6/Cse3/CasE [Anaerolineaceae bacterium]